MAGSKFKEIYGKGPRQVEDDIVKDAIRPGTFVVRGTGGAGTPAGADAGKFTTAGTANDNDDIFVLDKMAMRGQGVDDAYTAGDPGKAFRCITGCTLQVRVAAGTFTSGDAVTVGANGLAVAASGSAEVLGYIETTRTVSGADVTANANLVYVTFTNRPAAG